MSLVAAPADRRFRRAHVKPARRLATWRRLLKPLAISGAVALAVGVAVYRGLPALAGAGVLRIDRIVVRGNQRLSGGEILAVLAGLRGESIVFSDLGAWRGRLMSSPWVRDAALRRSLPSTVEVTVWERVPVATGRLSGELYLFDDQGAVIDEYGPQYADLDLPIVDGLTAPGDSGGVADPPRAHLAGRVIAALGADPSVAGRLSQIDVADLHNAAVILSGDPAVIYIGEDQFLKRLQTYLDLADEVRARVPVVDYVDLRFDNRIYVRPAEGGRPSSR